MPELGDDNNHNPWIMFARDFAEKHGITLGCAIRNKDARLEYNSKYKVKRSINNVPKQLRTWVRHSKSNAQKSKNNLSCEFSSEGNQESYREGNISQEPKKSPARVASIDELKKKLDGLYAEKDRIESGKQPKTTYASVKANISRVEALLDEKTNEYLKNPTPDAVTRRYKNLSAKKKKTSSAKEPVDYSVGDLEKLEDELALTREKSKSKGIYTNREFEELKQHAKMLVSLRTKIKNRLYATGELEKPPKKVRATSSEAGLASERRKKTGGSHSEIGVSEFSTDETARLGHPGKIDAYSLDNHSQIPIPPADYNQDYSELVRTVRPSRKFKGFGRISDGRRGLLFNADECRFEM